MPSWSSGWRLGLSLTAAATLLPACLPARAASPEAKTTARVAPAIASPTPFVPIPPVAPAVPAGPSEPAMDLTSATLLDARARKLEGAIEDAAAIAQAILADTKRKKEHSAAALLLGRLRYEQGRYTEAAAILRKATSGPLAATALYYLGESLFWSGEHHAARIELRKIIDRTPTSPWAARARLRTADALLAEGKNAAAAAAYTELLTRWPRYPRRDALTFALAQALAAKGARGAAAETWKNVWVRWPTSPLAVEAERELARRGERALPAAASDGERLERSRALRYLREHEWCERELDAFAAEVGRRPDAGGAIAWTIAWERAVNRLGGGDVAGAAADLVRLAPAAPAGLEKHARDVVAGAKARGGDIGPLSEVYERRVAESKTPYGKRLARLAAARFYLEHGEYISMRRHVEPLAKDAPKGGEVAWMLAWGAFREGRWAAARSALNDYCAARRWDVERCRYWMARAAEKAGARDDAIAGYEDLVLGSPFSYYALMARSRLGGLGSPIPPLGTADALAALARDATGGAAGPDADPDALEAEAPDEALDAGSAGPGPALEAGETSGGAAELAELLGTLGHGDEAYGAMGGRPRPADDEVFKNAVRRYGAAVPGLTRAGELWRLGFIGDARDELQSLYLLLAATRGWTIPVSIARRGWSEERSPFRLAAGIAGGGVDEDGDEVPEAPSVTASSAAGPDASVMSVAPEPAAPSGMLVSIDDSAAPMPFGPVVPAPGMPATASPALAPRPVAPPVSFDRVGPVDAKFVPTLGRLFAAVGDVHYSRRLIGPVPSAVPEDRLMRVYPRAFAPTVERAAVAHDLDPAIIWAVMHTESAFHPYVVSSAGARGLMQVMPRTGTLIARALGKRGFDPDTLFDPELSIEFGAWYLRELLDKFRGQLLIALAAYNGGPRAVERWLDAKAHSMPEVDEFVEEIPFLQSREYSKKVLAKIAVYRYLYGGARAFDVRCALDTTCEANIDF